MGQPRTCEWFGPHALCLRRPVQLAQVALPARPLALWSWRAGGKFRSEKQQAEERRETQQAEEHRQRAAEVAEALPSPAEASPPAAAQGTIPDPSWDR